jgi:hypothetical protein
MVVALVDDDEVVADDRRRPGSRMLRTDSLVAIEVVIRSSILRQHIVTQVMEFGYGGAMSRITSGLQPRNSPTSV